MYANSLRDPDRFHLGIIKTTIQALEKNNIRGYYAENRDKARELVMSMIKKDDIVGSGGSMTLDECGIWDELRKKGKISLLAK